MGQGMTSHRLLAAIALFATAFGLWLWFGKAAASPSTPSATVPAGATPVYQSPEEMLSPPH